MYFDTYIYQTLLCPLILFNISRQCRDRPAHVLNGVYWGANQRFFRSLCIASKVDRCIETVNQSLADGHCCIIGLQSTGTFFYVAGLLSGAYIVCHSRSSSHCFLTLFLFLPQAKQGLSTLPSKSQKIQTTKMECTWKIIFPIPRKA